MIQVRRERPAIAEERADIIRFVVVTNDGSPSSLIILTGLKNIFQKQLPKMPREYIARLVYDRNHYSMAIVKRGLEVVGGITYRPFDSRQFAEIVFCAITGTEQVKVSSQRSRSLTEELIWVAGIWITSHEPPQGPRQGCDQVHALPHIRRQLRYRVLQETGASHSSHPRLVADYRSQGFTKDVGLDRSVWAGYIKDYEGGTIMHVRYRSSTLRYFSDPSSCSARCWSASRTSRVVQCWPSRRRCVVCVLALALYSHGTPPDHPRRDSTTLTISRCAPRSHSLRQSRSWDITGSIASTRTHAVRVDA